MSIESILAAMTKNMNERIQHLSVEFSKIRSGRVTPTLVEHIKVDAYNTQMPLNQLATIHTPDPKTISITPFDKSQIESIEKALMKAEVGSMPTSDGQHIRLNFPPLSEERRKDMVKNLKKMAEECKVSLRQSRRDTLDQVKKLEKEVSKDDVERAHEKIQKMLHEAELKVTEISDKKSEELMKV